MCRFTPGSDFTVRAIVRMWAGVVPQQPPTPRTPSSMYLLAYSVKYSGLVRYITRPLISLGIPAFGMTTTGFPVCGRTAWRASNVPEGPTPQLIPTMSTWGSASSAAVIASAFVPRAVSPRSFSAKEASTAPRNSFATLAASRSSFRLEKVSRRYRSTPSASRAFIWTRNEASASAAKASGIRWLDSVHGPTAPATNTSVPAASRASLTPARLIASVFSDSP
jgi:hypothetical protein